MITNRVEAQAYPLLRKPLPEEPERYLLHGYHATSIDNWSSIQQRGLVPGGSKPLGQSWSGKWSGKATYFHQTLPMHELENSNQDGLNVLVLEVIVPDASAWDIVPDEDTSLDLKYVPKAMERKEPVAYGLPIKTNRFACIHLPDTPEAHAWARANVKIRIRIHYHKL